MRDSITRSFFCPESLGDLNSDWFEEEPAVPEIAYSAENSTEVSINQPFQTLDPGELERYFDQSNNDSIDQTASSSMDNNYSPTTQRFFELDLNSPPAFHPLYNQHQMQFASFSAPYQSKFVLPNMSTHQISPLIRHNSIPEYQQIGVSYGHSCPSTPIVHNSNSTPAKPGLFPDPLKNVIGYDGILQSSSKFSSAEIIEESQINSTLPQYFPNSESSNDSSTDSHTYQLRKRGRPPGRRNRKIDKSDEYMADFDTSGKTDDEIQKEIKRRRACDASQRCRKYKLDQIESLTQQVEEQKVRRDIIDRNYQVLNSSLEKFKHTLNYHKSCLESYPRICYELNYIQSCLYTENLYFGKKKHSLS